MLKSDNASLIQQVKNLNTIKAQLEKDWVDISILIATLIGISDIHSWPVELKYHLS
jgi:hypothetical protein